MSVQGQEPQAAQGATVTGLAQTPSGRWADEIMGWAPVLTTLAGGILTGLVVTTILVSSVKSSNGTRRLDIVTAAEIDAAAANMTPGTSAAPVAEARACKVPLAYVVVSTAPGAPPGNIRIASNGYLSPNVIVGPTPLRIPLPFPAPCESGHGVISVMGNAQNLNVWLTPGSSFPSLSGAVPISVTWTPGKRC